MIWDPKDKAAGSLSDTERGRLERAWELLEDGDLEGAVDEAEPLERSAGDHPEVRMLLGAILLDTGDPDEARRELEQLRGHVDDEPLLRFLLAEACFELSRFADAEDLLVAFMAEEPEEPAGHYALAEVREHLHKIDEAEADYRRAHELDPEGYPLPGRMTREEFETVVEEASAALPAELREHLEEIPVVVQALPAEEALDPSVGGPLSPSILGLYVGPSLREESVFDSPDVPQAIYIYQRNLERGCLSREELAEEITRTLYHELGHYLGLDEDDLEERDLN